MKNTLSTDELYFRTAWNMALPEARKNLLDECNITGIGLSESKYQKLPSDVQKILFDKWMSKKIVRVH